MDFTAFVLSQLAPAPVRVLEVGAGRGQLTEALAVAGHDALGIDPAAPAGPRFRRLKLADLEADELFDAVVASHTLHHVRDLDLALDQIVGHLREGGLLLVDEVAWDLLDAPTAEWLWSRRRELGSRGGDTAPASLDECWDEWRGERVGLHGYSRLRHELGSRFRQVHFSWEPYLYRYLDGVATEELERSLIESGAINAIGFRFVGAR